MMTSEEEEDELVAIPNAGPYLGINEDGEDETGLNLLCYHVEFEGKNSRGTQSLFLFL